MKPQIIKLHVHKVYLYKGFKLKTLIVKQKKPVSTGLERVMWAFRNYVYLEGETLASPSSNMDFNNPSIYIPYSTFY